MEKFGNFREFELKNSMGSTTFYLHSTSGATAVVNLSGLLDAPWCKTPARGKGSKTASWIGCGNRLPCKGIMSSAERGVWIMSRHLGKPMSKNAGDLFSCLSEWLALWIHDTGSTQRYCIFLWWHSKEKSQTQNIVRAQTGC